MEQARVVAKCDQQENRVEEAVVDQDGLFRIRGLTPGLKYVLSVESEQVKRSVPNTITIEVKPQDTKGHDFIALMQSSYIELSGSVNFEGEDPAVIFKEDPKAIVELYDAKNMELPLQSWPLSLSRYFQFSQLPRKDYILKVVPKRGPTDRRYDAKTFKVGDQGGFQKLIVPSKSKQTGQTLQRTALLGPLLITAAILFFFYKEVVYKWLGLEE